MVEKDGPIKKRDNVFEFLLEINFREQKNWTTIHNQMNVENYRLNNEGFFYFELLNIFSVVNITN